MNKEMTKEKKSVNETKAKGEGMLFFHSSVISRACYDAQCETMDLEFAEDDNIYRYYDVPEQIWYDLRWAESAKQYYNKYIRGRYREKKILDNAET